MDRGVLFIVMPFCGVERPQIGVSTLKAQLQHEGIPCDIRYFNLSFAESVDYTLYNWITDNYSYEVFGGEWVFARSLFSDHDIHYSAYVEDVLRRYGNFPPEMVRRLLALAAAVEPFLEYCLRSVDWDRYSVIGFTSTFEQNLPSLSLARRIKQQFPNKIIMMGGGNCAGPMGTQLHESFPFLDYVFTGEADISFPLLLKRLYANEPQRDDIKGYVRREGSGSIDTGQGKLIENLDALPYPNFDDYFEQYHRSRLAQEFAAALQIETARGCWWGAKQHCTFCGLNRDEMAFRAKSPERAMDEILHLAARYQAGFISSVDNIISMNYFKTLLPELKRRKGTVRFFYETKANLKEEHVRLMRDAGILNIQPGIESFSANTLQLMKKGVTPLQNVQLLKWCDRYGITPQWNLIYGFPGENLKDFEQNLDFTRSLSHLPPPMGYGGLRLDRFSPYFNEPAQYGLRNVRSLKPYRYLYPFEEAVLYNLAYFFDYDFDGKESRDRWFEPVRRELENWKEHHGEYRLETVARSGDVMIVRDTRPHRVAPQYRFGSPESSVIDFCEETKRFGEIERHLHSLHNGSSPGSDWLQKFLDYMIQHRLMLRTDDRYLTLIVRSSQPDVSQHGYAQ